MGFFGKKKAFEELKNSNAYTLALEIKDVLEKKSGGKFNEPRMEYYDYACGTFNTFLDDYKNSARNYYVCIMFSEYLKGLDLSRSSFINQKIQGKKRFYGIENGNIGIMVTLDAQKDSQDVPEYIKIAAEVIKNKGYGKCSFIENRE